MRRLPLVFLLAPLGVAPVARADEAADTATARALGVEGVTLATAGKCREAVEKLDRAEKLHHAPTTATRLAECEIELGKLVVGTERLQRVVREPLPPAAHPAFAAAAARAQKVLDATVPRLAMLRIAVHAPPRTKLAITIDGEPVSDASVDVARRIDPGAHAIEVRAPGFLPATSAPALAEGETRNVTIELVVDPSAPAALAPGDDAPVRPLVVTRASSSRAPAIVAFGAAAVGLGLGIYAATMVENRSSILASGCSADRVCPGGLGTELRDAKTWATVSTASFIGAGVGVTAGVVLLLLSPGSHGEKRRAAHLRPTVGPTSVGLHGTF